MIGQTISHYKITAKLGEGGMGVVYKAEDTKLDRTVALKFLAAHLLQDDEARKRFVREAKAAAALSHPNICTVHEIDEVDGRTFIAMAFVEGENLDAKIAAGPLKLNEILDLARQVAEGLQEAHSQGIYHRDVKPQNILISTKSGSKQHATIMDFGLAHLTEQSKLTQKDTSLGTVAYMSPEQTMGAAIDQRTDIWALGCVIYEMVCGEQPFKGHYAQAVTYSILNEEPEPLTALRTGLPMELEWIVGKCLAKEADSRYQNAADLVVDLKNLQDKLKSGRSTILRTSVAPGESPITSLAQPPQPGSTTVTPIPAEAVILPKRKLRFLQGFLVLSVLAGLTLASLYFRQTTPESPLYELTVDLPSDSTLGPYSLSPDGRHVALVLDQAQGGRRLWIRSMDSIDTHEMAGTDGPNYPFWSPDSRYIGFFGQGKLKKVALAGGPPQSLCDADDGRGGTWNDDGVIVFAPSPYGPIQRVSEGGGKPISVTRVEGSGRQISQRFPSFLPDGKHFLYSVSLGETERTGIYLGSIEGIEPRRLLPDDSNAVYARGAPGDSGSILFYREGSLMAQPFDPGRLELAGDSFPLSGSVGRVANVGNYGFSVSSHGSLLYVISSGGSVPQAQLAWVDRSGKQLQALGKPVNVNYVSLSPDETQAALALWQGVEQPDIWLLEFARGTMSRVTTNPLADNLPVWSPDGRHIAYSSGQAGPIGIYQKEVGGAGAEEALLADQDNAYLSDWSPDGKFLLFYVQRPKTSFDLWVLPLEGDRKPFVYLESEFRELEARFSPDGHWVAYASDESGRMEIYIRPFPAAGRKQQISTQGGTRPVWSKNGREMYYIDPSLNLMAVALRLGDTIEAGVPRQLFHTNLQPSTGGHPTRLYAVSRDGRFLMANSVGGQQQDYGRKLVLISDWRAKVGK